MSICGKIAGLEKQIAQHATCHMHPYVKGKVFSAAEGIGDAPLKMKRTKFSKRCTIRWDELLTALDQCT